MVKSQNLINGKKPRGVSGPSESPAHQVGVLLERTGERGARGVGVVLEVQEVAALAEPALTGGEEGYALLGFILAVVVVVLAQLVGAVGELAARAVGAAALLHELLAQLGLLLVLAGLRPAAVHRRGLRCQVLLRARGWLVPGSCCGSSCHGGIFLLYNALYYVCLWNQFSVLIHQQSINI